MGVEGAAGRLVELGERKRRAEAEGARALLVRDGDRGSESLLGGRGVAGVPDGVHWYDPLRHALVQVAPAPAGDVTTLVVTGVPWRTGWRYAERGWRHLYWDAGTLLAQLWAAASAAGLAPPKKIFGSA